MKGIYEVKLLNRREVALNTVAFEFEKPTGFDYLPGQYVDLKILDSIVADEKGLSRDISIASAPHEPNLLFVTRLRGSAFKNFLINAPIGAAIELKGPSGSFVLPSESSKPIVLIAGGIGITPFRSMASHAAHIRAPFKVFLFYANRRSEDAPFLEELKLLQSENPNYQLIATITKPETSKLKWAGERGYVNNDMISRFVDNLNSASYYIAGPPAMVQGVWQNLKLGGVADENLRTEEFAGY